MIIVDSSVWIDYFNGVETPETNKLDVLLGVEQIAIGDLILTEVLQGFRSDEGYQTAKELLTSLQIFEMLGLNIAIKSVDNYFGELDAQLTQIIDRILLLSPEEFTPLLLQLSREELITRFQSENQLWEELNTIV